MIITSLSATEQYVKNRRRKFEVKETNIFVKVS